MYADDLALIGTSNIELQQLVNASHNVCMKWGMRIYTEKTRILSIGVEEANILIVFWRMFLNFAIWIAL